MDPELTDLLILDIPELAEEIARVTALDQALAYAFPDFAPDVIFDPAKLRVTTEAAIGAVIVSPAPVVVIAAIALSGCH
jgi:hypothetical protein